MNSHLKFEDDEKLTPSQPTQLQPSSVMEVGAGESSLRTILWENPMWVEVKRIARRFMVYEKGAGVRAAISYILAGGYFTYFLFMLVDGIKNGVSVEGVIVAKLMLLGPLSLLMGYNVIAGERERRSWDLLRTAPLSAGQIVLGKFSGVAVTITGMSLLISLPAILSGEYGKQFGRVAGVVLPELACWVVLMFLCSLSVAVSARSRRSLTALSATIGLVLSIYVLIPGLIALFFLYGPGADWYKWIFPPELFSRENIHGGALLLHAVMTVFLLIFAIRSVKAVDRKEMQ